MSGYQAFARSGYFDGYYANIGAWMVHDACCGLGIREDRSPGRAGSGSAAPRAAHLLVAPAIQGSPEVTVCCSKVPYAGAMNLVFAPFVSLDDRQLSKDLDGVA